MPLNVPTIALHTAPVVVGTFFSHFLHSKNPKNKKRSRARKANSTSTTAAGANIEASANPKGRPNIIGPNGQVGDGGEGDSREDETESPETEFAYDEGLKIVKTFLKTAKSHTVEELQSFTAMHVPSPKWIHLTHVSVPQSSIDLSTEILQTHFTQIYGPTGLRELGGDRWWQVRGRELEGEWIEMKQDYLKRTINKVEKVVGEDGSHSQEDTERVILYIHGGAYFFSSLDTHRYQIQRHARKLKGRAFAPSYRLAPQYPFPCGLHDALASYLFLLNPPPGSSQPPIPASSIIISGDSAGAGLVLALLCIIRDSAGKVPLPAGACLISPWVDLTHSFKSIMGDDARDYIPSEGFHYKPSLAWPPLQGDAIELEIEDAETGEKKIRVLDDQVQMYTSNKLLQHPLVSLVNQGSLGGLCPLMIMGGSGELLRDEMIFLAHKAADPTAYPPSKSVLEKYPVQAELIGRYPPTKVHLQMYDGCAHVTPTLSFTKPAKWMYRAAANFNIWAITVAKYNERRHAHPHHHAIHRTSTTSTLSLPDGAIAHGTSIFHPDGQTTAIPISEHVHRLANEQDHSEDLGSEAESSSGDESDWAGQDHRLKGHCAYVTVRGIEPEFVNSMIRERVTTRGVIRPMEPITACETFKGLDLNRVGAIHAAGPIQKWLASRAAWDNKYKKELAKVTEIKRQDLLVAERQGWLTRDLQGETPPLTAMARWADNSLAESATKSVDRIGRRGKSVSGMVGLWIKAGEKEEESSADHGEIAQAEETLRRLGLKDDQAMSVVGDKKVGAVRDHLEREGVLVVPAHALEDDERPTGGLLDGDSLVGGREASGVQPDFHHSVIKEEKEKEDEFQAGTASPKFHFLTLGRPISSHQHSS